MNSNRTARRPDKLAALDSLVCDCGNVDYWDNISDRHTGSMWYVCRLCGKLAPSERTWIDWSVGLFFDTGQVVGSEWTQKVGPQLFCSWAWSRLTT